MAQSNALHKQSNVLGNLESEIYFLFLSSMLVIILLFKNSPFYQNIFPFVLFSGFQWSSCWGKGIFCPVSCQCADGGKHPLLETSAVKFRISVLKIPATEQIKIISKHFCSLESVWVWMGIGCGSPLLASLSPLSLHVYFMIVHKLGAESIWQGGGEPLHLGSEFFIPPHIHPYYFQTSSFSPLQFDAWELVT